MAAESLPHWLLTGLLFIICYLSFSPAGAQSRFEATVIDAQTQEVLPFASVYVIPSTIHHPPTTNHQPSTTITNAVGTFAIDCDSTDVLRISYVGYKTAFVKVAQLGNIVPLTPNETMLQEVQVMPVRPLIDKICKETLRMARKYKSKNSQFFYRQTAFSDSVCYEFVEAFLSGCPAVALHDMKLLSGRYAGLQSDSTNFYSFFGNFYTFSQVEVAATYNMPKKIDDVVPLFRNYDKFYDVTYKVTSEDSTRIFVLHFVPKPEVLKSYAILDATLYVDAETMHLRRIVGEGRNFRVMTKYELYYNLGEMLVPRTIRKTNNTVFSYDISLTEEHGFPEVQSAFVEAVYELDGKTITTRSLLYNIGQSGKKSGKRSIIGSITNWFKEQYQSDKYNSLDFGSVLHKKIEQLGYDPEFWNKNEIVRRTPIEQDVLTLFEQQNLFGIMSTENAPDAEGVTDP